MKPIRPIRMLVEGRRAWKKYGCIEVSLTLFVEAGDVFGVVASSF